MNTKMLKFAFLFASLFGTATFAASETQTSETESIAQNNDSEETDDTNFASDLEKCKNLKAKILGNKYDPKRVVVYSSMLALNLAILIPIFTKTIFSNDLNKIIIGGIALTLHAKGSEKLYENLLKKYECAELACREIGMIGMPLYALFNKSEVCSNLKKVLANYDAEEIPSCLKKEFDALAEEYQANNGSLTMTNNELLELIMEIILPELNKVVNPQVAETAQS